VPPTGSNPIRIGEINTYSPSALSGFMPSYKNGILLAVQEANEAGGALGRPLEVVFRDDKLIPAEAARQAESLIQDEKVDLLAGTFTSDVGVAVAEAATRMKRIFIASEPRTDALIWDKGSRYVFRIRTSQSMMIEMLLERAKSVPQKRWAVVGPSYQGGKRIATVFKERLGQIRPDVTFVGDYYYDSGKMNGEHAAAALEAMKPDAMLSVVYGTDLLPFVRAGNQHGLFRDRLVVNPLAGDPEYLDTLGAEAPEGWLVLGYPWRDDNRPAQRKFADTYQGWAKMEPDAGALVGYMTIQAIAAGIARAGSLETEALIAGFRGLEYDSPIGRIRIRPGDHQATVGNWIGTLGRKDGRGIVKDWTFLDGANYLPPEDEARTRRPAGAND